MSIVKLASKKSILLVVVLVSISLVMLTSLSDMDSETHLMKRAKKCKPKIQKSTEMDATEGNMNSSSSEIKSSQTPTSQEAETIYTNSTNSTFVVDSNTNSSYQATTDVSSGTYVAPGVTPDTNSSVRSNLMYVGAVNSSIPVQYSASPTHPKQPTEAESLVEGTDEKGYIPPYYNASLDKVSDLQSINGMTAGLRSAELNASIKAELDYNLQNNAGINPFDETYWNDYNYQGAPKKDHRWTGMNKEEKLYGGVGVWCNPKYPTDIPKTMPLPYQSATPATGSKGKCGNYESFGSRFETYTINLPIEVDNNPTHPGDCASGDHGSGIAISVQPNGGIQCKPFIILS